MRFCTWQEALYFEMASVVGRMWVSFLVAFLLLMTEWVSVTAHSKKQHTFVVNQSSQAIRATITYYQGWGTSSFYARLIPSKTYQQDEYHGITTLMVYLWVNGSKNVKAVKINEDRSIVAYDSLVGKCAGCIDIFLTRYGDLIVKDYDGYLVTIYPDHAVKRDRCFIN